MKKILTVLILIAGITAASQAGNIDDFKKRCSGGDGDACATLGAVYAGFSKSGVVKKDIKKATEYWKRGCELNSGSSCTTYSFVIDNENERLKVLKKACDLGNENGCLAYKQSKLVAKLQDECVNKGDHDSCRKLGGEVFLEGEYKSGKTILEGACKLGNNDACTDVRRIEKMKEFRKLSFADVLAKKCTDKKDKYACEKLGRFLVGVTSLSTSKATTKDEKKAVLQEVMMNMMMGQVYLKESCKLGRKEACRTVKGLESVMKNASSSSK